VQTQTQPRSGTAPRHAIVYLPIEFQSREYDSKVLLAATLAQRGYPVVVGQQWLIYENLQRLPAGVVLFKTFNKFHQAAMGQARRGGHRVVILDEEMLAQTEVKAVEGLCTEGIFQFPDVILADGQFEHDILKRLSGGKNRIEITGNGRVDLLKPAFRSLFQKRIDAIKAEHGDFVLVNTNFSILNSMWQSVEEVTNIQIAAGFIKPNDPVSMQIWKDYLTFEEANREGMHAAIRELARRRPDQRIVVRPHPGEELKRWDGVFTREQNVRIIREGAHIPWTMACRVLLHTSCTTGFEAYVAGKTALSLTPKPSWITSSLFSNHVNPTFESPSAFVDAVEAILDGGAPPPAKPQTNKPEFYVWNCGAHDATQRVADILLEGLPKAGFIALPALQGARDPKLKSKFDVSLRQCVDDVARMRETANMAGKVDVLQLGESLFIVAPPAQVKIDTAPKLDQRQIRAAMDAEMRAGRLKNAYEVFRANFGEAHRSTDLCFLAGICCFELGDHRLALQYFQQATLPDSNTVNFNVAFMLARTYQKLRELDVAYKYAELAYKLAPASLNFFGLFKELAAATGRPIPQHWLVIGCSHVRYFRYMQINQPRFFDGRVNLECYEYAGATAFGLGNANSDSGALKETRNLRPRMAIADRVLINFGEIDCRRAAWKAAAVSGRTIEETIAESVAHLKAYVEREILPHNKKVLVLGAKPQIIGDEDFYANSLADERTVFKPLEEREKVTLDFNRRLKSFAAELKIDYADIDHVLADDASRRTFFDNAFWDSYTDDTHGNADYFAQLYFERLKRFAKQA
jgi:surface carbohydrate biosynthesis protein